MRAGVHAHYMRAYMMRAYMCVYMCVIYELSVRELINMRARVRGPPPLPSHAYACIRVCTHIHTRTRAGKFEQA